MCLAFSRSPTRFDPSLWAPCWSKHSIQPPWVPPIRLPSVSVIFSVVVIQCTKGVEFYLCILFDMYTSITFEYEYIYAHVFAGSRLDGWITVHLISPYHTYIPSTSRAAMALCPVIPTDRTSGTFRSCTVEPSSSGFLPQATTKKTSQNHHFPNYLPSFPSIRTGSCSHPTKRGKKKHRGSGGWVDNPFSIYEHTQQTSVFVRNGISPSFERGEEGEKTFLKGENVIDSSFIDISESHGMESSSSMVFWRRMDDGSSY